jgi:hypothetical protein
MNKNLSVRAAAYSWLIALAAVVPFADGPAIAAELCPKGLWADFMIGSQHIHPDREFDDFNPGAGIECSIAKNWAAAFGYFRNSLDRPSFYGGALYTPDYAHWGWFRLGAMGGIITGYNYGQIGLGAGNRTGPVVAPVAVTRFGRFGANFILIPPIREDHLPFTVGLQVKYRVH